MARLRGGAGQSTRHTGDQYQRGYVFKYPQRWQEILGPWNNIAPGKDRDLPTDTLKLVDDGMLRNGMVSGAWGAEKDDIVVSSDTGSIIHGAYEMRVLGVPYHVTFRTYSAAASDYKNMEVDTVDADGNIRQTSVFVSATPIPHTVRVIATAWQNLIFFSWIGAAHVYQYDPATFTLIEILDQDAYFLEVVNNNLLVVNKSGSSFLIKYSVDSDLDNFTDPGSGQIVVDGALGEPRGLELLNNGAMLLCENGAMELAPTGSASPAFSAVNRSEISGVGQMYATTRYNNKLFYLGKDRKIKVFNGSEQDISINSRLYNDQVNLAASNRLGVVLISSVDEFEDTLMLNPDTLNCVCSYTGGFHYMADSPESLGQVKFYVNLLDVEYYSMDTLTLNPAEYTTPAIETGYMHFGRPVYLERMEVMLSSKTGPKAMCATIVGKTLGGADVSKAFSALAPNGAVVMGSKVVYYVNCFLTEVQILLQNGFLTGDPWTKDNGIEAIQLYGYEEAQDA